MTRYFLFFGIFCFLLPVLASAQSCDESKILDAVLEGKTNIKILGELMRGQSFTSVRKQCSKNFPKPLPTRSIAGCSETQVMEYVMDEVSSKDIQWSCASSPPRPLKAEVRFLNVTPDHQVFVDQKSLKDGVPRMELERGMYQLNVSRPHYETRTEVLNIQGRDALKINTRLKPLGRLFLSANFPEVVSKEKLVFFIKGENFTKISRNHTTLELREGSYTITASYSSNRFRGGVQNIILKAGQTQPSHFVFTRWNPVLRVRPKKRDIFRPPAVSSLQQLKEVVASKTRPPMNPPQKSSSSLKWIAAGGSVFAMLYTQMESQKVSQANEEQKTFESQMESASTEAEWSTAKSQAHAKYDEAESHKQSAGMGQILSLLLGAWTGWLFSFDF